jgi:hypothetical protein
LCKSFTSLFVQVPIFIISIPILVSVPFSTSSSDHIAPRSISLSLIHLNMSKMKGHVRPESCRTSLKFTREKARAVEVILSPLVPIWIEHFLLALRPCQRQHCPLPLPPQQMSDAPLGRVKVGQIPTQGRRMTVSMPTHLNHVHVECVPIQSYLTPRALAHRQMLDVQGLKDVTGPAGVGVIGCPSI